MGYVSNGNGRPRITIKKLNNNPSGDHTYTTSGYCKTEGTRDQIVTEIRSVVDILPALDFEDVSGKARHRFRQAFRDAYS